ncbi:hypothetical protein ACWGDE_07695 [Streptomyces sp. NPDC054956]
MMSDIRRRGVRITATGYLLALLPACFVDAPQAPEPVAGPVHTAVPDHEELAVRSALLRLGVAP